MQSIVLRRVLPLAAAIAFATSAFAGLRDFDYPDHYEFEASLQAPFHADANHTRQFGMQFRFPGADELSYVAWRLDLVDANGFELRTWRGESPLVDGTGEASVDFSERSAQLADGIYQVRMRAYALNPLTESPLRYRSLDARVEATLESHAQELEDQTFDIQIGNVPKPAMPAFKPLVIGARAQATVNAVAAAGGLPYTVYLGNLHSQTNLSDGGGPLSTCDSEQAPQSANGGTPTVAYTYAMNDGLDFLMTSEHNHMFDGSTGTNSSADPATAKNLYQSGQTMRDNFNAAHPNFLALAGLEWGVISNGGHMNIFNTPKLLEWEYNSSNQLLGDVYTAKGDYAGLFTQMNQNGWIGQFNHPASGQFLVNGTSLGYTADGDAVMVACEVMNSSAFSSNATETETSLNSYIGQCNKALEAGYHVAFTSDQDNHCANWGASYHNRTGVLIPNGQALTLANFYAALRARHVYATYDKTSQVVLTTDGGHIMGDRFDHSGALTLTVNYAPGAGRSASQVQVFEGVPGSNGTVTQTSSTAVTTITPANGEHFYYAKVTQDNGTLLYSAPVWVTQGAGGDTTPPTVSASESGSSGTITLSASASDNVGASKVEFYVDGTLKGSDTSSPYSMTLDSTTLANGSHSLVAKAYDAAGNIGTSSTVSFSVSNATGGSALTNGVGITIADATKNHQQNWTMAVPAGATNLVFSISGGTGDADLYVKFGSAPTTSSYDCRPYVSGNSETCTISTVQAGTYYVMVNAYAAYSGVTLKGSYTAPGSGGTPTANFTFATSGLTATFTDTSTDTGGTIGSHSWNFGDGSTSTAASPSHAYAAAGTYTATETVADSVNTSATSTKSASVTVSAPAATQLLGNTGFETGTASPWTASSGVVSNSSSEPPHAGSYDAWMDGYGSTHTDTVSQTVTIPAGKSAGTLQFYLHIDTAETTTTKAYDKLTVTVGSTTVATLSNLDAASGYQAHSYSVPVTAGSNVVIKFKGVEDSEEETSFVLDDVTFTVQ
jgi:PKD repeat protein